MESNKKYFYPKLSDKDFGYFRVGGPGLANCMFFAAKAYVACSKAKGTMISPTWCKFSIGPYIRHEKDKRAYISLFKNFGISGLRKTLAIIDCKLRPKRYVVFSNLGNYFGDLQDSQSLVKKYFESIVYPETIANVTTPLSDKIAIHIRLGDYLPHLRIPISWYVNIVKEILKVKPRQQFVLFSDGKDEELKDLLNIPNVSRAFFGNAFADIWAISKCKLLIASDSTFSAWGAFLGKVPIIFNRRHFPAVYGDNGFEFVLGDSCNLPSEIISLL